MKQTPLKRISDKRKAKMEDEIEIGRQLCKRCGGHIDVVRVGDIWLWHCIGGRCEKCGKPPDFRPLAPHEKVFRSQLGRVSLENSQMWCGKCHNIKGHNIWEVNSEPRWSKG